MNGKTVKHLLDTDKQNLINVQYLRFECLEVPVISVSAGDN